MSGRKLVHIVDNADSINFGIWNAALFGHEYLRAHGFESVVILTSLPRQVPLIFPSLPIAFAPTLRSLWDAIRTLNLSRDRDVVISHGCWLNPTKFAYELKKIGFTWIYVPHGMLEPWSRRQHRLKKWLYFNFFEKRKAMYADTIRAVSGIEKINLSELFKKPIVLVENGVMIPQIFEQKRSEQVFLFLGRLHRKKGVLPLVQAWSKTMKNRTDRELILAGPDEGELPKIAPFLGGNMRYIGPVYGDEKSKLLMQARYFLLPSFSEGFPVSVLEAMSYGVIPVISTGCNFEAVFQRNLGYRLEPEVSYIANVLNNVIPAQPEEGLSRKVMEYVATNFAPEIIGQRLLKIYQSI